MMPQSAESSSLQDYLQTTPVVKYAKGQELFQQCSHDLCYMVSGVVELRWKERHYGFALPGDFFGDFENSGHESALVKSECHLMRWNPAYIQARVHYKPLLGWELLKLQAVRNQRLKEILVVGHLTCRERLIWHLLSLTRQFEAAGLTKAISEVMAPDGVMLPSWLTHKTLSEVVGTSREIVTQMLGQLTRSGAFKGRRGHWEVVPSVMEKLVPAQARRTGSEARF